MTRKYIADVIFVHSEDPISSISPDFIHQDLNEGSHGHYIYAVKSWTKNSQDAVTSFAFVQNEQVVPVGFEKINQDLNQGAGGSFNYLCIQRGGPKSKVTDIILHSFDKPYNSQVYEGWTTFHQDLNTGAKRTGKFIYLFYKTE
jgi:hypothetical protein